MLDLQVLKAIPREVLARDPRAKKAAKSAQSLRRKLGVSELDRRRGPRTITRTRGRPPIKAGAKESDVGTGQKPEPGRRSDAVVDMEPQSA